jgi:hypothetical protein
MTPYLVTPPVSSPVTLAEMKAHLRVDFTDDDDLIAAQQEAAVAYLDAHGGVLGRCIMPQVWAIDVTGPGPHLLPFPDASGVEATVGLDAVAVDLARSSMGWVATMADAATDAEVKIEATYGLSAQRLPAAQMLVKLLVSHWYEHRAAVNVGSIVTEMPMAAHALIAALRWRST